MNKLVHRLKNQDGFTLIELLIVIVILGVLAAIVVFAVGAFTDEGEDVAADADCKNVEVAVEAYRAKNDGADPSWDDLTPDYLREEPDGAGASPATFLAACDAPAPSPT